MLMKATPKSRSTGFQMPQDFQMPHLIAFGLEITERYPNTHEVTSVRCKFCTFSGREEKLGQKRQRRQTTVIMLWKPPYHAEKYRNHYESQHAEAWITYQALTFEEKQIYFNQKEHHKNTLLHSFGLLQTPLVFKIDASIVDTIIGNLFFHPDGHGGLSQVNVLKLFKPNTNSNRYTITLTNLLQFRLAIDQIAIGLSFQQVEAILASVKHHTGLTRIGSANDTTVANYARVV